MSTAITVRRVSGALGAEISGVDLAELDDAGFDAVHKALLDHHVVFFRDQELRPEDQIALGRRWGDLNTHPYVEGNATHPEIIDVITEPDDRVNFGGGWHTDVTFHAEPDKLSILYGIEIPPYGGDTLFANQHLAYEELSDVMKDMLDRLTARHSAASQYNDAGLSTQSNAIRTRNAEGATDAVEHPVIRTHPETRAKGLYVNRAFTEKIRGLRPAESRALLDFLFTHAVQEKYTCRFAWQPGSIAIWDNRSVQHHALLDYHGHRRVMRRVTVCGDRPI